MQSIKIVTEEGALNDMDLMLQSIQASVAQAQARVKAEKAETKPNIQPECRKRCPVCSRLVWLDFGFLSTHREDPPSSVICSGSGGWAR